jgi:hypothetical protein
MLLHARPATVTVRIRPSSLRSFAVATTTAPIPDYPRPSRETQQPLPVFWEPQNTTDGDCHAQPRPSPAHRP